MFRKSRAALNSISAAIALSLLSFFAVQFYLDNPGLLSFQADSGTAYASAGLGPAPETVEEEDTFLKARMMEVSYDHQSPAYQATWNTVSTTLYRELGAYDLRFELTDDPAKNCGAALYDVPGGCYHSGGAYDRMIFVSPEGIEPEALKFITAHEYSHHLQYTEGGTRYSANLECDADLRALELRGAWVPGFERQCLAAGMDISELTLENLPKLEAQLDQSK